MTASTIIECWMQYKQATVMYVIPSSDQLYLS